MGKTKGRYNAEFSKGSAVKIADRASLNDFVENWQLHHKLEPNQLNHAGKIATVESVGFYHGGDELYTLSGVPGIWHVECLTGVDANKPRSGWVYLLPAAHLSACLLSYAGIVIPSLQFLGIVFTFVLIADLPISALAYAVGWEYPALAASWIFVVGTLWWYLISILAERLLGQILKPARPNPS